jgi:hypothetical protein
MDGRPRCLLYESDVVVVIAVGTTFDNGAADLHSPSFNWHESLTVVRRDPQSYGCARFVVRNANGRHGYAFGRAS